MKVFARAATVVALLLAELSAANAQVQFAAKATISIPANGAQFHAGMLYAGQYVTFVTSTSSAHLYLTTIQGNAPDDFHSNFIQCDSIGNFTHYANNSSAPGALTATYRYSAGSYTSSATSDIYNLGNTSQKGHDSSSTSFTVVYP